MLHQASAVLIASNTFSDLFGLQRSKPEKKQNWLPTNEMRKNAIKCRSNWNNWNHRTRVARGKNGEQWNNVWHYGHILSGRLPAVQSSTGLGLMVSLCCFCNRRLLFFCIIKKSRTIDVLLNIIKRPEKLFLENKFSQLKVVEIVYFSETKSVDKMLRNLRWLTYSGRLPAVRILATEEFFLVTFFSPFVANKNECIIVRTAPCDASGLPFNFLLPERLFSKLLMLWWFN